MNFSAFLTQCLASLAIAYLNTLVGLFYAWPSCTLENLTSNSTVLSSPMSTMEISLFSSLVNVGALLATPFCGYVLRKFGRKYSALLFGVPFVIAWTIISLTTYVSLVILAMGIAGLGCAGIAPATVYIGEISQDSFRGTFASFGVIGFLIGLQLSYILGGYLTHYQVIYFCLSLSIIYMVLIALLKDSPVYLMQNGNEKEAEKSIVFYRRIDISSPEVKAEINKIELQLRANKELILQDHNGITEGLLSNHPKEVASKTHSEWKFLLNSESSKRALAACIIIMSACLMMGTMVIQVYAEPLFKEAVPSMDSSKCAIYLGVDFILGSVVSTTIIDSIGRKNLLTASSAATGICTLLLGTQQLLHWAPQWCTALLIYLCCFVYSLGAGDVPFILPSEVFLPEVRGLCNSMVIGSMWLTCFVCLFIFNPLVEALGIGIVFCGFSVIGLSTALYSQICLPETKGLSADAIQVLFMKNRSRSQPSVVLNKALGI